MTPSAPYPLLPRGAREPLLDSTGLRALEAGAASLPGAPLMERAGLSAARLALALWPGLGHVRIYCGPGNNGGDGLVMARHLHGRGIRVDLRQTRPGAAVDRQRAERLARHAGLVLREDLNDLAPVDLAVDALLGIGLREAPRPELAAALTALAGEVAPRFALDLPSGLDADRGRDWGAARCAATLSFLAAKPGLLTGAGPGLCGSIWIDRLGLSPQEHACAATVGPRSAWRQWSPRQLQPLSAHKGDAGSLWVLGGPPPMQGAGLMAARAGLAAGAGRVYLAGATAQDAGWPELMTPGLASAPPALRQATAVAGCGGGERVAEALPDWLSAAAQLVLDADALNAVARDPGLASALAQRAQRGQRTVLTPHPLEAARLLQWAGADAIQADRLAAAQTLAERWNCTILLKGSGTVVASPGSRPLINLSGHAALATAGTGDVLAGWLGGLMAQAPLAPLHELAGIASAWHGDAADALPLGGGPLRASRLIEAMAKLHPA